jgi:hypothetical protein
MTIKGAVHQESFSPAFRRLKSAKSFLEWESCVKAISESLPKVWQNVRPTPKGGQK